MEKLTKEAEEILIERFGKRQYYCVGNNYR